MLQSLKIENIAIIEKAELTLSPGFNVMTGETGAGKSIIIDSINAVLGERTSKEIIRTGASSARVSAMFTDLNGRVGSVLDGLEIEHDGELLIQRTISADGKNSCRLNGSPVTVTMLKAVGRELINIHGQHDSQSLLSPEKHVTFIDSLAGNDELRQSYAEEYRLGRKLRKELSECDMDEAEKARRLDVLQFQIDELTQAELQPGEKDELAAKRALFQNLENVMRSLDYAYTALSGTEDDAGARQNVSAAADCLDEAAEYFEEMREPAAWLHNVSYEMQEVASQIRGAFASLDIDESEIEYTEERLDLLYKLSRKYGGTEEEMLLFLDNAEREVESITLSDERIETLRVEIAGSDQRLRRLAGELTESRQKAASAFETAVKNELRFLDMPGVTFKVAVEPAAYSQNGADAVEFLISANAGETPKPIAKIASGGELSRIMLAIKNVLSDRDEVATLIFDEIDTGISGRAAQKVAQKLLEVSKGRQVVCVTHLAQIAAKADAHMLIQKSVRDGKTFTDVERLDFEGRKYEIARINGGSEITEIQLKNAEEMLGASRGIGD